MKLCTFMHKGSERVGLLKDKQNLADITIAYAAFLHNRGETKAYKLADAVTPPSMKEIIEGGESSLEAIRQVEQVLKAKPDIIGPKGEQIIYPLDKVKLLAPVPNPSKILAPALNHRQGWEKIIRPETEPHPVYFIKLPSCVTGAFDPIEIPDIGVVGSEVEIGAVIAKKAKNIPLEDAAKYVFGYTVHNDITGHEMRQKEEWIIVKGPDGTEEKLTYAGRYKCFDTFAPMGPWIVTPDEIKDIHNCKMEAKVNNELVQDGSSADMVFRFPELISYFSRAHTLEPGDIISSGTVKSAAGWNIMRTDLRKLGGVLESRVEGIGVMKNPIKPV
jgi:2-keto-4-pentenoate hydratase/2-oxohepta-3-ene-1,7-dioic acid hydratase in catechol pathway